MSSNSIDLFLVACSEQKRKLGAARWIWNYNQLWEEIDGETTEEMQSRQGANEWRQAISQVDQHAVELMKLAKQAARPLSKAGYEPADLFRLAEAACSWERFTQILPAVSPNLRAASATIGVGASSTSNTKPSLTDQDTFYAYSAAEAYLVEKHDVPKPKQLQIYQALKATLDNEIDREDAGISEGYEVQATESGFLEAYRRYCRAMKST